MPSEARRPEDRSEPTAAGSTTGAEGADRWDTWRLYFETTARLTSRVGRFSRAPSSKRSKNALNSPE